VNRLSVLVRRWHALVQLLVIAAIPVCVWRTVATYHNLRSDLEELLPQSAPSVGALATLRARMPAVRYLGVVIDTGGTSHVAQANRFADALGARIAAYPASMVAGVQTDFATERHFADKYALQLAEPADVRRLREAVERRRDWETVRAMDMNLLDESDDPRPKIPIDELRLKYQSKYGATPTHPGNRFVSDDGRTVVLLVRAASTSTSYETDAALLRRVRADVARIGLGHGMRVGYAGDVATRVEEIEGLTADLTVSGLLAVGLVLLSLRWFFRNWWSVVVLGAPLALGVTATFGLVALPPLGIRHLNTNTGFLASVIVGNGINSGIILLARFAEERRRGLCTRAAVPAAVAATWRATLAAATAAATAYGSLVFTDFRGFSQFGWVGGIGMLTCWATTYLVVPRLLERVGDRFGRIAERDVGEGWGHRLLTGAVGRPRLVLGTTLVLAVFAGIGLERRGADWLEMDLSRLRRRDSFVDGERYWGHRMDTTLKRYLTPTVILASSGEQAARIRDRVVELSRTGRAGGLIGSIRSSVDLLPPTREASLAEARKLKDVLTPRVLAHLAPDERALVDSALSDAALRPLTEKEIPDSLAAGLRENGSRMDRNVLVFPTLSPGTWDGPRIHEYVDDLREASSCDPKAQVAGSLPLSGDITGAMWRDGPRATALGFVAALVVCMFAFGSLRLSLWAMGSLVVGVLVMMGSLAWTGARLNFSNFVVLPITFGVSADYAINVLRRYQLEGTASAQALLANTAGAVGLCSATTIIGFGSLLAAQNQALFSFGVFASVGEIATLSAAALALPAWLVLQEHRPQKGAQYVRTSI
jgi:predicted RND superfamily exporter protein